MDVQVSEHDGQVYDTNALTYSTTSTSPGGIIQNAMYPEYTEWHQGTLDPTRQSDVTQYQAYMGYNPMAQGDIVNAGSYWQGEMPMHPGIGPFSPYGHSELQSINFSNSTVQSLGKNGKPKRKRVQTMSQRRAANIRERRRMFHLNEAFDELRKRLPAFNYEKRLSRIETLRLAITYISFMKDISDGEDPKDVKLKTYKSDDGDLFSEMRENINVSDDSMSA